MKRGYLLIIMLILAALPSVMATTVNVNGPNQVKFNIGDIIEVSGKVYSDEEINGFLQTNLICDSHTKMLRPVVLNLNAGEDKDFPSEISIPEITATESMIGNCEVEIKILEGEDVLQSEVSDSFEITKSLRGSFTIENGLIQLGMPVKINGIIQRMDGTPLDGRAEVFFRYGDMRYSVKMLDIVDGKFFFEENINGMPTGAYFIDVEAKDGDDNEQSFEAAEFTLSNELSVAAETNRYEFLPGDEVEINAEVWNILQAPVELSSAYVKLGTQELAATIKDNKISHDLVLPEDIKSGKHTLSIVGRDSLGNKGVAYSDILIKPVATEIKQELNTENFKPGDMVNVKISVFDQASDLINDYIKVNIYNSKDNLMANKNVPSGQNVQFELPKYATPGEWQIASSFWDLEKESLFNVEKVKSLATSITGEVVTIRNEGNAENDEPIELTLNGEEGKFTVKSREKLEPGETVTINLNEEVPSGIYTMAVADAEGDFGSVTVTEGKKVRSLDTIFSILVILLVGMIVFMGITMKKKKMTPKLSNGELHKLAKAKTSEFSQRKNVDKEKQEAINDFKKVTLEEIKRTEEANKKNRFMPRKETTWIRPKPRVEEPPKEEKKDEPMNGAAGFFGGF